MSELPPPAGEPYGAQPQQDAQQPRKKGLGVGAIVGIVLGLVALIGIGVLAAVALPLFSAQKAKADDSAAKADVATLGRDISMHFVDSMEAPDVTLADGMYTVGKQPAWEASDGVEFGGFSGTDWSDWCVWVHADGGDQKDWQYSAVGGLEQGTCS